MKVIGLTGGIASGKSTIANLLRSLGAPVFDADAESRALVAKGRAALNEIALTFGIEYLTDGGELNRPKMAELVFHDKEALKKLEAIIHKNVLAAAQSFLAECRSNVLAAAQSFLAECRSKNLPAAVLDVPLLIECGWYKDVDAVWLVAVDSETQIERAMARSNMTREEVKARIAAQMTLEEKKAYASLVIDNSGTFAETEKAVAAAWKNFTAEA